MKQVNFPVTKAQKDFEDLAKTLLSVMAELPTEKQIEILEFAYKVDFEEKHELNAEFIGGTHHEKDL